MYKKGVVSLVVALCLGAGGCVEDSGEEDSIWAANSTSGNEGTGEAQSAFTASPNCTEDGGGTWGAIFRMCVSISDDGKGTFTIVKTKEPLAFQTAGTMYLKVGTYEPWGVDHANRTINGGSILSAIDLLDEFGQWPNYPKEYYARWESKPGGYAWVPPASG